MNISMLKSIPVLMVATLLWVGGCSIAPQDTQEDASPSTPVTEVTPPTAAPQSPVATESPSTETALDTVVIPGERFGSITPNMTRQDLAQLFGEEQLEDENVSVGEGFVEPGTQVNLGADQSFHIIWTDATRTKISAIRDMGSAWKTPEGIGMGTSLATLQEKLGDFWLYGFAWDYGGTIKLEDTALNAYDHLLVVRLAPEAGAAESYPDDYSSVMGDTLYASDNPHLQKLNPTVDEMIVYLTPPSQ